LTLPEAVQDWAARCSEHLGDLGPGDEAVADNSPPLNRQLAPRPLPATSRARRCCGDLALRLARLNNVSLPSNAVSDPLRCLAAEIEALALRLY